MLKLLAVDEFTKFNCLGGKCPLSCCGGNWGIMIDDESYERYMTVKGKFGDRLRAGITKINGTNAFCLDDRTKDCVFLNSEKLCEIYRNLGKNMLCDTCKMYPRIIRRIGNIEICYLTNSCPEVNRMIIQRNDTADILYDDSDEESNIIGDFDENRFDEILRSFVIGRHVIQNDQICLADRIVLLLMYSERIQSLIKNDKSITDLLRIFDNPEIYTLFLDNLNVYDRDIIGRVRVFILVYKSLINDSYDHPMWQDYLKLADKICRNNIVDIDTLETAFSYAEDKGIMLEAEHLMIYRFSVVFLQGYNNIDFYEKLAYETLIYISFITYIALTKMMYGKMCTQEERIMFYSLCRRIDHTQKQIETLVNEFIKAGLYKLDKLIKLLR